MSTYRFTGPVSGDKNHFGDGGTVVNVDRAPTARQAAAALVAQVHAVAGHLPDGPAARAAAARIAYEIEQPQPDLQAVATSLDSIDAGATGLSSVRRAVGLMRAALTAST